MGIQKTRKAVGYSGRCPMYENDKKNVLNNHNDQSTNEFVKREGVLEGAIRCHLRCESGKG